MRKKLCKECGRILGVKYFVRDVENPYKILDICIKCANEQNEINKQCSKCGQILGIRNFSQIEGSSGTFSMCRECRKPYLPLTLRIAKRHNYYCEYTTTKCPYSAKYGMCCIECPMVEWCDEACKNKPLPEPNGCG